MGVALGDLVEPFLMKRSLSSFKNQTLVVDAHNAIYQFLSSIRQRDGTPLMDSKGRITSHLSGILYRNANIIENGARVIYVFDGRPPEQKHRTLDERSSKKRKAEVAWSEALEKGDFERARSKAAQSTRLTRDMVEDSKDLLRALGIPIVQASTEGEAQAAFMVQKGAGSACISQDYDSLLFGSSRLARNIAVSGKRKLPGRNEYINVSPETLELTDLLKGIGISREQLIDLAIIVGTDFNEGVHGYGPKKALAAVRGGKKEVLEGIDNYREIRNIFLNPEVTEDYDIEFEVPDGDRVIELLCDEHDFSEERVKKALEKFRKGGQKTLDLFV